ncbi:MAG TPA: hypothetical protein VLA29_13215 [Acidimicrobiia bacterium]|nr:hypothetical protein [Acidimicrobiia bacterium]
MTRFSRRRRGETVADAAPFVPTVGEGGVIQVCHPQWRGVRSSAIAFGDPILESPDLNALIPRIGELRDAGVATIVIQGWPPGSAPFARAAQAEGMDVRAVSHSAPTQHGVDSGEAEAVAGALELLSVGVLTRFGTVKAGLREAYASLGHTVDHVPNRVPEVSGVTSRRHDGGTHAGVFLFPMWRKNVATQILAARTLGWTPHVMADPNVPYLSKRDFVAHGEIKRDDFLPLMASMDINLNVTLSECHPMMPMESYRLGVPCLMSRTSDLFAANEELWELTTVDRIDDPSAIATAAKRLSADKDRAVELANLELDTVDAAARSAWWAFTGRSSD